MLRLNNISLLQFKNYQVSPFQFTERVVGICGKNGIGKTNLLDAIYYTCFTKSYFSRTDVQNVRMGMQGFRIEADFIRNDRADKVECIVRENGKKELLLNGSPYAKFSEHIGRFPCVMIAPDDIQIITDGSEERRRFLDALISQVDHGYLLQLISYNKILQQRNSLLKQFAESGRTDHNLMDVINEQLAKPGDRIFQTRKKVLKEFIPMAQQLYRQISGEAYDVKIDYESQLHHASYETLLFQFAEKDLFLQRTSAGIHKDDLAITLDGNAFKTLASQGQKKSLLFACKLAEFEYLKKTNGFPPLLLLDDIFEKLDEFRMQNLLQSVCVQNEGQIFITDTHCDRLHDHLHELGISFQLTRL